MNIAELLIIICIFILGALTCNMLKFVFGCIFKSKPKDICGRYTNVVKCEDFPNCENCPYKADRV